MIAHLPPPLVQPIGAHFVLRDDRIPGGTKRRVLDPFVATSSADEFVYASPAYGYAQVALAHACSAAGKQATVFVAHRAQPHPRTSEARAAGARIVPVPYGYLSNVQSKARAYASERGAVLLPFGLDTPELVAALADVARAVPGDFPEIWVASGSGVMTRALQRAWPRARHVAVRVGTPPNAGTACVIDAPEPFEGDAKEPPPFPSCSNYDAKVWRFFCRHAAPGALYWNVAK